MNKLDNAITNFFDGLRQGAIDRALNDAKKNNKERPVPPIIKRKREIDELAKQLEADLAYYGGDEDEIVESDGAVYIIARIESASRGIDFYLEAWESKDDESVVGERIVFDSSKVSSFNDGDLESLIKHFKNDHSSSVRIERGEIWTKIYI